MSSYQISLGSDVCSRPRFLRLRAEFIDAVFSWILLTNCVCRSRSNFTVLSSLLSQLVLSLYVSPPPGRSTEGRKQSTIWTRCLPSLGAPGPEALGGSPVDVGEWQCFVEGMGSFFYILLDLWGDTTIKRCTNTKTVTKNL